MSTALVILNGRHDRDSAIRLVQQAPTGTRVLFKASRRSGDQNAKLWAMLTEVATQVEWHGQKLGAEDWKLIFLAGLKQSMRIVPNLDGDGFVSLGRSSSRLTKQDFSDLLELIHAFGANHNVEFRENTAQHATVRHSTPLHDTTQHNTPQQTDKS